MMLRCVPVLYMKLRCVPVLYMMLRCVPVLYIKLRFLCSSPQIKGTFLRTYSDAVQNYNSQDEKSQAVDHVQRNVGATEGGVGGWVSEGPTERGGKGGWRDSCESQLCMFSSAGDFGFNLCIHGFLTSSYLLVSVNMNTRPFLGLT